MFHRSQLDSMNAWLMQPFLRMLLNLLLSGSKFPPRGKRHQAWRIPRGGVATGIPPTKTAQ